MCKAIFRLVPLVFLIGGCSSGGSEPAAEPDGGGPVPIVTQNCGGLGKSQTVSQPCCLAYGVDACGANLFCAAFDGRTQPTCYPERSRMGMSQCTADVQCTSDACNVSAQKCRSLPGEPCDVQVGCSLSGGSMFACVSGQCKLSKGQLGDPCGVNADCLVGTCSVNKCVGAAGTPCNSAQNQCGNGMCCQGGQCGPCGGGVGAACDPFINLCQPSLTCCGLLGSASYCYATCT